MQKIHDSELAPEAAEPVPEAPAVPESITLEQKEQTHRLAWLRHPSAALRQTLFLFGMTRLLFVLVTYAGYVLFNVTNFSFNSAGVGNLLYSWNQWDAVWYLNIVQQGYHDRLQAAFFPLYPLLIRLGSLPFGDAGAYAVGLAVSNIAFFFALWALRVLAERECGPEAAARATLYLAVFPTALFFFAPYNESLFLLLTVACFLALRSGRWWLAGGLGLLAALTRDAGVFLVVPFVVEYLIQHGWRWRGLRLRWDALAVGLIPAGLGLYSVYCWLQFGDPLMFADVQAHWKRALDWPWAGITHQVAQLWQAQPASFFQAHDLLDLVATLAMIALVLLGWRRLPLAYSLFAATLLANFLLFPMAVEDPLTSNQRFALEVFPAFLTLGLLVRRPATHQALTIIFTSLLTLLTLVFITGRWLV